MVSKANKFPFTIGIFHTFVLLSIILAVFFCVCFSLNFEFNLNVYLNNNSSNFCLAFVCLVVLLAPGEFTDRDVEVFRRYLTFCGIGIQNAQLFEMSVQEYRRNQILLNLARSIFEEQNNLECLVTKILTEARELLKCTRCAVFLLDLDCCESVCIRCLACTQNESHFDE